MNFCQCNRRESIITSNLSFRSYPKLPPPEWRREFFYARHQCEREQGLSAFPFTFWTDFGYKESPSVKMTEGDMLPDHNYSINWNLTAGYSNSIFIPRNLFFVRTLYFKVYVATPLTIASLISAISFEISFSFAYQPKKVVGSSPNIPFPSLVPKRAYCGDDFPLDIFPEATTL